MRRRAGSPAVSEAEVDILDSLFTDDVDTNPRKTKSAQQPLDDDEAFDFDGILNGGVGSDDDGDEAFIALRQAASFRKASNIKGNSVKKGGGFQAMGLNANLLRAITKKGFSVPTPIQRKTVPVILQRKDVVGMARTGSGKTAAFVIPMIERLKAHSAKIGSRALILSPSRELAIQTLKVVKEFGRGTDLKSILLVGGDSLEDQFGMMTTNPDIIIATPGRFLHLKVEMALDLSSIKYVVFDEADRLFEMGFAAQLTEILHALPPSRQTLLFSATLPASLVEFARAGLQEPTLIRLDAETKMSPDLQSAFFTVKGSDKEGALLHILHDIISIPPGLPEGQQPTSEKSTKKRKRNEAAHGLGKPTEYSTIIFASTKHHVEYLSFILRRAGFAVSYVYGSLDQEARRIQVEDFRSGKTHILVVTDVAARGIDIPVLQNVINYDFPPQPKVFVHRVGRTARAGKTGWSYSLVRDVDAPYLLDLQLFLGRKLVVGQNEGAADFVNDVVVGAMSRASTETHVEWFNKELRESDDLAALRRVADKAHKLYMKSRHSASSQSAKRARELVSSDGWTQLNLKFGTEDTEAQQAYMKMLQSIGNFKPQETIFEIGMGKKSSHTEAAEIMKQIRKKIIPRRRQEKEDEKMEDEDDEDDIPTLVGSGIQRNLDDLDDDDESQFFDAQEEISDEASDLAEQEDDDDDELEVTVSSSKDFKKSRTTFEDPDVFMSYTPRTQNMAEERGYGVHSGSQTSSFVQAARDVTLDLTNDETAKAFGEPTRAKMRWDKKSRKYVSRNNDEDGSRGAKMVVGESGVKIAASFQSGRFDRWRRANRLSKMPRVGDIETRSNQPNIATNDALAGNGRRFKHKAETAPKEADKYRDDYHVRKKRVQEAREKRVGRFRDGEGSRREIRGAEDIRRLRKEKERRREKNARQPRKK